ncbi:MAG TPA: TIGR03118 family protein [Bryobacteraceae bacterium]|jgi:uncharacterized protein (TIGR03118 family)|nr:TIGR03118 family protein [Bryobacteraceae bacterium]
MKHATLLTLSLALAALPLPAASGYLVHNLVSDVPGAADFTDPNLVNAWGISISGSSPFWVCDGGTGLSTVYSSTATSFSISSLKVSLPPSGNGGNTVCTGQVFNSTTSFAVGSSTSRPASFIFATTGGTLSGWASAVDASHAQMAVDNSASGAVYTGLALVTGCAPPAACLSAGPFLYAANFSKGTVDVFDGNWKPVTLPSGAFTDPAIPAGYSPYNIQLLNGSLYVTYAKLGPDKVNSAPGAGAGYVDVYDPAGKLLSHLVAQGPLNAPWGIQIAPATFPPFGGDLLVGNFGDGTINAFNLTTGAFAGTLQDQNGNNLHIDGLWGLQFGNGGSGGDVNSLYFAAGPSAQKHGLFGIIVSQPIFTENVVNAADPGAEIGPNTMISIIGGSLGPTTRSWASTDFNGTKLPTSLDGVSVSINGSPAFPTFVSPRQINVLTPADLSVSAPAKIVVTDNGLVSQTIQVPVAPFAPAFFLLGGKYAAAVHGDGKIVGPTTLVANNSTPAAAGETIALFATGLGATTPAVANGQIVSSAAPLAAPATVLINGIPAPVAFAGIAATGLYQVNVTIPAGLPSGDNPINIVVGGFASPGNVFVSVQ